MTATAQTQLNTILTISDIDSIQLTGHTDSDGNNDYNLKLSQNRVLSVQDYLSKEGFDKTKIRLDFFGENQPLTENNSENAKQQNRRVEILIFLKPNLPKVTIIPEKVEIIEDTVTIPDTLNEIVAILEDTTLWVRGIRVVMSKKDFNAYNGTLQIEPILTVEDAMRHNLTTMTTSNRLLVSDGMINVNALPNGGCFKKSLKVYFPMRQGTVVRGRRNQYVLKNGKWKVGGRKRTIDVVTFDNISYYELVINCPGNGPRNCDVKVKGKAQYKFKVPLGYSIESITVANNAPLAIYNFGGKKQKRKIKFNMPCFMTMDRVQLNVEMKHKKKGTVLIKNKSIEAFRHSIRKNNQCLKNEGILSFYRNRKFKPYKKYSVPRRLLAM